MIALLTARLGSLFSPAHEEQQHEAYLASSSDLAELERRIRHIDSGDSPFGAYSNVMPRDHEM